MNDLKKLDKTEIVEMHVLVYGSVQGVGFRATTRYYALKLDLRGSVKNLPEGNVEIYAQGPREKLNKLLHHLKLNSKPGYIERTEISFSTYLHEYSGFQII